MGFVVCRVQILEAGVCMMAVRNKREPATKEASEK